MTGRASPFIAAGLVLGAFAMSGWVEAVAGAAGAALLVMLAPVPLKALAYRLRPFFYFSLVTLVVGGLGEGRTIAALGAFHWSWESVQAAGVAAVRLLVLGAEFSWVGLRVGTARLAALAWSAGRRLKRRGVNIDPVLLAFAVAVRFLPLLQDEARRLRLAWEARGGGAAGRALSSRIKGAFALAVPLLAAALRRAEEFASAVDVRTRGGGMASLAWAGRAASEGAPVRRLIPQGRWRAAACVLAAWAGVLAKVWSWLW